MALYLGNQKVAPTIVTKEGVKYGATGDTFFGNIDVNGVLQMPTTETNLVFTSVQDIGENVLRNFCYITFKRLSNIKTAVFPNLTSISGNHAMEYAFSYVTGLTNIDLSNLTTVSGGYAMQYAFQGCTGLTGTLDLSSLTSVSGSSAMTSAFQGCTGLTSVDLSNLTKIQNMSSLFKGCTSLTNVDFSSVNSTTSSNTSIFENCTSLTSFSFPALSNLSAYQALQYDFKGCTSLTTLSFPALASVGSNYQNQFYNMLQGVTGCTVHFPSNLQSVIGSWSDVTSGFGGTNTTVLFDLPATT